MERKYYRQYENYDRIIPRAEDFPVLNVSSEEQESFVREIEEPQHIKPNKVNSLNNIFENLKLNFGIDDIVLLAIIIMLLMEDDKDELTIIALIGLFLSGILF